jgi:hypothetical protein
MDKFEFFFSLLSLLLGLALTQLAGGMASALKLRSTMHIGWLTPLAALVVCLDIASFWPSLWGVRELVEIRMPHILTGVGLCLGYYMAAAFIFPDDLQGSENLDAWYFATRRFALGGTLILSVMFWLLVDVIQLRQLQGHALGDALWGLRGWIIYIALLLIAIFAKRKGACIAALGTIIVLYPLQPFLLA